MCVGNEGLEDGSGMQLTPRSGQEAVIRCHSSSYQPHFSGFSRHLTGVTRDPDTAWQGRWY